MSKPDVEMIGASDTRLRLEGAAIDAAVKVDRPSLDRMNKSFRTEAFSAAAGEPDRVFLKFENIRGANDAAIFYVYVGLPDGADPADHPENLAGSVSLFGVRESTRPDGPHGGNGISQVIEISHVIDALHLGAGLDMDSLNVRLVPDQPVGPGDDISVGRISLFRQAQ